MASFKILVTGATGYIGGSILSYLLEAGIHEKHPISVLVRGEARASVLQDRGVKTVLFESLDDVAYLQKIASEHDMVIHTASGFHTAAAKALVLGLADRKKETGKEVHYVHTTGTSNMSDQPISGAYHEVNIFTDKANIYAYEKYRESLQVYAQRTTDLVAIETGLQGGVSTHLIMSPLIYGSGTGLFNKFSIQIPTMMRKAIEQGEVVVIGEGKGIWDYIHISDVVSLYGLLIGKILAGEEVPTGEMGILFSSAGRFSWSELSENIAKALFKVGAIKSDVVRSVEVKEMAKLFGSPAELPVELGFAANSRTSADVGRELGWKPVKTEEDFKNYFLEEAKLLTA